MGLFSVGVHLQQILVAHLPPMTRICIHKCKMRAKTRARGKGPLETRKIQKHYITLGEIKFLLETSISQMLHNVFRSLVFSDPQPSRVFCNTSLPEATSNRGKLTQRPVKSTWTRRTSTQWTLALRSRDEP